MMKKLLAIGNRYADTATVQDFAFVKLCLGAMGVILGMFIPRKKRPEVVGFAAGVFIMTFVPLMAKTIRIVKDLIEEGEL